MLKNRVLRSFVESQGIGVELLQVVIKVGQLVILMPCVHFLSYRSERERMRDVGVDFDLCDCANQFGHESNFMRCSQGVQLEDFVPLDEILAPVLVTVVPVRVGFRVARKGVYKFGDAS